MKPELSNEMCLQIADLIEGYAIGALDDSEMLLVADRIGECPKQQEQLLQYEETVGLLGLVTVPIQPSATLWERLDQATTEGALPEPIPIRSAERRRLVVPNWAATALAAAAILLLISTVSLGVALRRANNDDNSQAFESTVSTYLTSGGQVIPLTSLNTPDSLGWAGRGSLLVAPNMPPMVVVDKCVPSSKGYAYVVWLQRGDQRTPMGNIEIGQDGRGMMTLEGVDSLAGYDVLGITIHTSNDWTYDVMTGSPTQKS
jgi:Anti-sigma-K factor rskA